MMTTQEIEKASAAIAKAPRITLEIMESEIAAEYFLTAAQALAGLSPPVPVIPALAITTMCIMTLRNGFVVIGHSTPMSPDNFNIEHGERLARDQCIRQLWPHFAFFYRQTDLEMQKAAAPDPDQPHLDF